MPIRLSALSKQLQNKTKKAKGLVVVRSCYQLQRAFAKLNIIMLDVFLIFKK
jgi:hypothetical protein